MKIIKKTILILAMFFGLLSCSDDFLDEKPQDSLIASNITIDQVVGLRNNMYNAIPDANLLSRYEAYSDNAYSRNFWDSHGILVQSNGLSAAQNFGYSAWGTSGDHGNYYSDIRLCNSLIENIDAFAQIEESVKSLYKAEARVLRAWKHMELTLLYGKIAIVETLSPGGDEGIPRNSITEVRQWILNELDLAIEDLPVLNDLGYFNKAQAYAVKARAAYYFGMYKEAAAAADYVISNGGYSLNVISELDAKQQKDADFFKTLVDFDAMGLDEDKFLKGIFNYESIWDNENNPEVIISKEYNNQEDFSNWNRVILLMSPNQTSFNCWNIWAPMQDLVDSYWSASGDKPILDPINTRVDGFKELTEEVKDIQTNNSLSFNAAVGSIANDLPSKSFMKQFLNRDSRLYASIAFPFAAINKHVEDGYEEYDPDIANFGQTGYTFRKMSGIIGDGSDFYSLWSGYSLLSDIDVPIIRLAEMLLIYAEAQTQDAGYDAIVVSRLNLLRDRCGMPNVPSGLSKDDALDLIRRERRIEMANEGLRFFDIRLYEDPDRNGGYKGSEAASVVMQGQSLDPNGIPRAVKVWDQRLMLMPLPSSSIDRNPALVGDQNPGY